MKSPSDPKPEAKILLVGNPNSGKTLLFNRLTGLRKSVANFPGVTVQISKGRSLWMEADVVDFPGIYSLNPLTKDEEISVEKLNEELKEKSPKVCVCVLDVTRLERSLFLFLQLRQLCDKENVPLIMLLNMVDQLPMHKLSLDLDSLSSTLDCPLTLVSAKTKQGFAELKSSFDQVLAAPTRKDTTGLTQGKDTNQLKALAKDLANKAGLHGDLLLKTQFKIDRWVLSKSFGSIIFIFTMLFLFQAIFSWAAPLMDGVESLIGALSDLTVANIPSGIVHDFFSDAIFGGFGSFLVFVPQIFILTFIIGLLEDSGYLARAALICHKPLGYFGLSGKSFVSLLTGHACAIPAIFAARNIESRKKRILTMTVVPLVSCSARLPVYGLFIASLIPAHFYFGGLVGLQGLAFFALYFFGIISALVISAIASKTLFKKETEAPFVLELPPYRWPSLASILKKSWEHSLAFVTRAGPMIFMVTAIVWALGYFPTNGTLETSYLASLGKWIDPIFAPIGIDWRFGVAIITSFLAREVFVGTLGTMFGIEGADEDFTGLAEKLQNSGMTLASGVALLAFYAIAMQCVATLSVLKKEMGSWKIPSLIFVVYSLLAYIAALIAYFIVSAF